MVINFHNGKYFLKFEDVEKKQAERLASQHCFMEMGGAYFTASLKSALGLREYFSDELKLKIKYSSTKVSPWSLGLIYNTEHTLDTYQKNAALYCLNRNNSYLGLEQGLGKTIILSVVINTLLETFLATKVVIAVPPFLITNWVREIKKWSTQDWRIYEYRKKDTNFNAGVIISDITIVADSILLDQNVQKNLKDHGAHLFITDEADRFCNFESQRTIAHTNIGATVRRRIRASGTPMPSRPRDLYAPLQADAHNIIDHKDYIKFAERYCGAYYDKTYGQFVDKGESNKEELHEKLKPYMLMMEAKNYLDLPPVAHQLVILDETKDKIIKQLDKKYLEQFSVDELIEKEDIGLFSSYRAVVSLAKKKSALEVMKNELEYSKDTYLILGAHTELLKHLHSNLKGFGLITGATPDKEKYQIEDDLNAGKLRGIIANIKCMVGQNYQACNRVKFFESSWSWKDNDQAFKRVVRRGQTRNVLVEHYVIANTIEEYVLKRSLEKGLVVKSIIKENT